MSRRFDVQDATGDLIYCGDYGELLHWSSAKPANGTFGYSPGCTWRNLTGAAGSAFYVNVGTKTSSVWVELTGPSSTNLARAQINTAVSTVGAATLSAAAIVGGLISRTGSTAAFTDTTDTLANIVAAMPNATIGQSWVLTIVNYTAFAETLAGGTNVTFSGPLVVPGLTWSDYLVTYVSATSIVLTFMGSGEICDLPSAQYATGTTTVTFTAAQLTGAGFTVYANTGATPGSIATRTATQMVGDIPNAQVGMSYLLRVINAQGTGTLTITAGTGVTLTGTMTIAANTWRDFVVTINTATTLTIQNAGVGTFS